MSYIPVHEGATTMKMAPWHEKNCTGSRQLLHKHAKTTMIMMMMMMVIIIIMIIIIVIIIITA